MQGVWGRPPAGAVAAGHLVGVGGALHSLQSAHDEHEAGIQQHQPP